MNTIEPSLRSTISYIEVAEDLWKDIKELFSVGNGPCIQQLKTELIECKQGGLTIVAYYRKLKKLWEELANYEQMPTCKCGLCICNIESLLEKKCEEEKVHQFLMGLDETIYGTVRSDKLAQDPLPNLNRVYSTLVQEERVRTATRGKEDLQVVSRSRSKFKGKDKDVMCSNCNCPEHESSNCFQLIGYLEWCADRPRGTVRGTGRGKGGMTSGGIGRGGAIKANAEQASSAGPVANAVV